MGQLGLLVGAILGGGSVILVGESSFVTDWWIVLLVVAAVWVVPPVFWAPPGSATIALAHAAARDGLPSTANITGIMSDLPGSANTAAALVEDVWRIVVFAETIPGFIAGVIGGGVILLVSALASPAIGAAAMGAACIVLLARRVVR